MKKLNKLTQIDGKLKENNLQDLKGKSAKCKHTSYKKIENEKDKDDYWYECNDCGKTW